MALERSGRLLARVSNVFYVLAGAHTNDAIQAIERDMAPALARHWNEIHLNEALFARLDALHRSAASLGLTAEQARVLERYHALFRRAGRGARFGRQRAAEADRRAAREPRHDLRPERAGRRAVLHAVLEARTISPGCRISSGRRRAAAAEERGLTGHA